jgi:hypothetical protein
MRRLKSCRNKQKHSGVIFTPLFSASYSLYYALDLSSFLTKYALFSKKSIARKKSVQVKKLARSSR